MLLSWHPDSISLFIEPICRSSVEPAYLSGVGFGVGVANAVFSALNEPNDLRGAEVGDATKDSSEESDENEDSMKLHAE